MGTWSRRSISISLYVLAWLLVVPLLPLWLLAAGLGDLVTGRRWPRARVVVFAALYLTCELIGLLAAWVLWLGHLVRIPADRASYLELNHRLQWWWARVLGGMGFRIFGLRIVVKDDGPPPAAAVLLLVRHASVADTVLAAIHVSSRYRMPLRYVLKRELLWDPCLDVVGMRVPNCFVSRDAADSVEARQEIATLGRDCIRGEGVLIYPEGTRFTQQKRERIISRYEKAGDFARAERARAYRWVLPPRHGGVLALLDEMKSAEVWLCVHAGLERAVSFASLWKGELIGQRVDVEIRRIDREAVPEGRQERCDWLDRLWREIDEFVAERSSLACRGDDC